MDDNSPGGTTLPHVWRSTDSPQSLTLQIMIFAEVKKKTYFKINIEPQRTLNIKNNFEKKKKPKHQIVPVSKLLQSVIVTKSIMIDVGLMTDRQLSGKEQSAQ